MTQTEIIEEIKEKEFKPELKAQEYLSPSSINTFYKCPRQYFYRYIAKLPERLTIDLVKGSIVHSTLEHFFKEYNKNLKEELFSLFEKQWIKAEKDITLLELKEDEITTAKEDMKNILTEYFENFNRKLQALIKVGKAENEQHAFFLIKPKFRELKVESEKYKCRGYIDRVSEDYNGILTLADYKTSVKYGVGLPMDYKRQLSIYALLYQEKERLPDFVAVNFLRYGEEYLLEVGPSVIKFAINTIQDAYSKTRSANLEDYPLNEGSLCRWCPFLSFCSGQKKFEDELRLIQLEKKIGEKNETGR